MLRPLIVLSLAVSSLSLATPGWAQESGGGSGAASFEDLLRQGIEQRRQGNDSRAAALFREALALTPDSARAQAHLATAYHALGDWLAAHELLRSVLARTDDAFVVRHRDALERELAVVEDHLGKLQVIGNVSGAEVRINGRLVGVLPMKEPAPLIVGSYRLEITKAGYAPLQRDVTLAPRGLVREEVTLVAGGSPIAGEASEPWAPRWVPWTLGTLALAGATTAGVSYYQREDKAETWNDCLVGVTDPALTRDRLCGPDRDAIRTADTALVISGVAAGAFGVGALVTALVRRPVETEAGPEVACSVSLGGFSCSGAF